MGRNPLDDWFDAIEGPAGPMDSGGERALNSVRQFVEDLLAPPQEGRRITEWSAFQDAIQPRGDKHYFSADRPRHAKLLDVQPIEHFFQDGHRQFRRRGRGGRSNVGDEVRDGDVHFVPDRANDGDPAGEDRTGHDFLVERPQVFQ